MKKKILAMLLLAATSLPACKDFLEEKPYDFIATSNFFKNEAEASAGLTAVYGALKNQVLIVDMWYLADLPGNQLTNNRGGGANGQLDKIDFDTDIAILETAWGGLYDGVNRANAIIERVPKIAGINPERAASLVAEARFLRGLFYFNLIRLWGNVPLITTETVSLANIRPTNEGTAPAVWQLIIDDFTYAEEILPATIATNQIGRASKWAAKGMLAKVYLQRSGLGVANEWQLAAQKAKEVIDSKVYDLHTDFADNFKLATENGKESIFAVQLNGDTGISNTVITGTSGPGSANGLPEGGSGTVSAEAEFYNSYADEDKRKAPTFLTSYSRTTNGITTTYNYPSAQIGFPYVKKYKRLEAGITPASNGPNIHTLRYADVLLIYSEAMNEVNGPGSEAYSGVNQVRRRAGLSRLENLNKDELRDAILQERAWELAFEGHSYFDAQRTKTLNKQYVDYTVSPHEYLLPLPGDEVFANPNLKQNPGYGN